MLFSKFSSIPFEKCPVHTSVLQGDLEINAACGDPFSSVIIPFCQGGLATASDLAAFLLSMITPVKKSVNHSRTVASMRETGWEQQHHQEVRLRKRLDGVMK